MSLHLKKETPITSDPCADKLAFDTKEQADGAKVLARLEHGNEDLTSYTCDKCGLWHLTTNDNEADET